MPCYHPLRAVVTGTSENGKKRVTILKKNDPELNISGVEYLSIPCGKCIGCRLDYSRSWADRCMLEAMYHERNSFITLTYNDNYLPDPNLIYDKETGEVINISPINPLVKKDFQKFMKRLREHFEEERIRFFACGEYGSLNNRPHYHAILFGEDFSDDRQRFRKNFDGSTLYISDTLDALWPFGFSTIGDLSWNSAAYVARYCIKKRKGKDADIYEKLNYPPEFTLMSRKPGIGRQYYEDNKDKIYKNEEIFLALPDRSLKLMPSRYYDNLYDIDNPDRMEYIRNDRKFRAEQRQILKNDLTSLHVLEQKQVEEYNKKQRTEIFKERSVKL